MSDEQTTEVRERVPATAAGKMEAIAEWLDAWDKRIRRALDETEAAGEATENDRELRALLGSEMQDDLRAWAAALRLPPPVEYEQVGWLIGLGLYSMDAPDLFPGAALEPVYRRVTPPASYGPDMGTLRDGPKPEDMNAIPHRRWSLQARERVARVMCDHAARWGDRLHGWDESGEDVRRTFREGADEVLAAVDADAEFRAWQRASEAPTVYSTPQARETTTGDGDDG